MGVQARMDKKKPTYALADIKAEFADPDHLNRTNTRDG
jgi:hypothetical protein